MPITLAAVKPGSAGNDVTDVEAVDCQTDTRAPDPAGLLGARRRLRPVPGRGPPGRRWTRACRPGHGVGRERARPSSTCTAGSSSEVQVREGQCVKQGDVLVVLDDATIRATFEAIRQNYLSQRATGEPPAGRSQRFAIDQLSRGSAGKRRPGGSAACQSVQQQSVRIAARRAGSRTGRGQAVDRRHRRPDRRACVRCCESRHAQAALQQRQVDSRAAAVRGRLCAAQPGAAARAGAGRFAAARSPSSRPAFSAPQSAIAETQLRIAQRRQEYLKEVIGTVGRCAP